MKVNNSDLDKLNKLAEDCPPTSIQITQIEKLYSVKWDKKSGKFVEHSSKMNYAEMDVVMTVAPLLEKYPRDLVAKHLKQIAENLVAGKPHEGALVKKTPVVTSNKKIIQFGYKNCPVPKGIPLIDCQVIPNPFHITDPVAQRHAVRNHEAFPKLVAEALEALKTSDTIGVGCGYGVHRSGEVVHAIQLHIWKNTDYKVEVEKLNKKGVV